MKLVKKVVSQILKEKRNWVETVNEMPESKKPVILRLCHRTIFSGETDTEQYPLEDIKLGYYDMDSRQWIILPPHPKYDYSPLSNQGYLRENVDTTHWAIPEEKELEWWTNRYNRIRSYGLLELKVDPENEKEVYRALLHGAAFIHQYAPAEEKKLSEILYDLMHCIDFNNTTDVPKEDPDQDKAGSDSYALANK